MNRVIHISIADQTLVLTEDGNRLFEAPVSTAVKGVGEKIGSECTPRGRHIIRAKIGAGSASNTVFEGRRATGEVYSRELGNKHPERDWILSRILWLSGVEAGVNRLGDVDTMRRYIYIHGMPDEDQVGVPGSHGCVRMRNTDIIELFDMVDTGTLVIING